MNTQRSMEERLWEYIDGHSSAAEHSVIEKLLQEDAAWKTKYHELLQVNDMLKSSELEQPSMRFTKNVMEEIAKLHIAPAAKTYLNQKIIWGIGIFFIGMLVAIFIFGFNQVLGNGQEASGVKVTRELEKIDFSRFFSNTWVNAMMMINVVIGLFLLDNYLSVKRKKYRKEA
ncbi:MAG: hypothetical protein U0U70_05235 [Chitinophagaceae bacterium]